MTVKTVIFGEKNLRVKVAMNEHDRATGLMHLPSLPKDEGMLFVMREASPASFWMKNTRIPLDIAFLNERMEIIKFGHMLPFTGKCKCALPVKYVVEANEGWFANNGIAVGDKMKYEVDDSQSVNVHAFIAETLREQQVQI